MLRIRAHGLEFHRVRINPLVSIERPFLPNVRGLDIVVAGRCQPEARDDDIEVVESRQIPALLNGARRARADRGQVLGVEDALQPLRQRLQGCPSTVEG